MRTNVKSTGSAHRGLNEWVAMRLTALYMVGFSLFVLARWGFATDSAFETWRAWFGHGAVKAAWAIFFLSVLIHAWFGVRSVFMDYVRATALRFIASALLALALLWLALWAADLIWSAGT